MLVPTQEQLIIFIDFALVEFYPPMFLVMRYDFCLCLQTGAIDIL